MNKLDKTYTDLLQDILDNGVKKQDRTGTGTISVFGRQIRHDMKDGFPLLTTKKMPFKTIVTELLWFLRGDTNIKYLVDNGCNIWNGDAYKSYEKAFNDGKASGLSPMCKGVPDEIIPKEDFIEMIKDCDILGSEKFAKKWGELGPIYGRQWRNWDNIITQDYTMPSGLNSVRNIKNSTDQIQNLIQDLKTNPDSRRLIVSAWNVGELDNMVLPPCHNFFQCYTSVLNDERRYNIWFNNNYETGMERFFDPNNLPDFDNPYYTPTPTRAISLMWNQRSVDTFLGLPFNIASYGLLLEIIAKEVNMVPDQLIGNLGDVHLYLNHIEQAKEQIGRKMTHDDMLDYVNTYDNKLFVTLFNLDQEKWEAVKTQSYEKAAKLRAVEKDLLDSVNFPSVRTREPFELPVLALDDSWKLSPDYKCFGDVIKHENIKLFNYLSHPEIKAPLSN